MADTLGWAYYKLGSPESAVIQLKKCAEKAPNNAVYQYHLSMACLAAGHFDSAEQALKKSLRDDPHFFYAASARGALEKISKPYADALARTRSAPRNSEQNAWDEASTELEWREGRKNSFPFGQTLETVCFPSGKPLLGLSRRLRPDGR